ncbi:MAG TPA: pyrimidine dimer DNA glycosylase/endonuclease V [Gemmatimonadales bacterium]|nr:pyrimidine dimer DNA glycosylase/endonuclease V [Gemmatimonadales bacterium]
MRIWDLSPRRLCRQHLLGEHRELHAIWAVITGGRKGYAHHPETLRWRGKLRALRARHERLVDEMGRRGYSHFSPLDVRLATGSARQRAYVDSPADQVRLLRKKACPCEV